MIYYVSIYGSDAWDGSINKPFRTLRVATVLAKAGDEIKVAAGIYIELGMSIGPGVSITGEGVDKTIFRAISTLYYNPETPGYSPEKYLFSLINGALPQTLSGFTIDGDMKRLHGGIYVRNRGRLTINNVKVVNTNFNGVWLWDVSDSNINDLQIINSSWGSSSYCVGALNIGGLRNVDINRLTIDENRGYGIKAIGPTGNNSLVNLKIHDSRVSVNPVGLWGDGLAPNIAIELWSVSLVGCEIFKTYVDNTISLVSSVPSNGIKTIRVHNNIFDMETRAKGAGYSMELTVNDVEIDRNQFIGGSYGIANWGPAVKNWNIHHNSFFGLSGQYPGEMVRAQDSGLHSVKFYNNIVQFSGTRTMNVIGIYGGVSEKIDIQNNLLINNNTAYSYYPNTLIHQENGAKITELTVKNNAFIKLPIGSVLGGVYVNNVPLDLVDFQISPNQSLLIERLNALTIHLEKIKALVNSEV